MDVMESLKIWWELNTPIVGFMVMKFLKLHHYLSLLCQTLMKFSLRLVLHRLTFFVRFSHIVPHLFFL